MTVRFDPASAPPTIPNPPQALWTPAAPPSLSCLALPLCAAPNCRVCLRGAASSVYLCIGTCRVGKYHSIRPIRRPTATSLVLPSIPPVLCWRNPPWPCHWLAYFPRMPTTLTASGRVNAVHRPHRTDLQTVASTPCTCCLGPNSPPALSYLGPLRVPMAHGPLKFSSTHTSNSGYKPLT